MTIPQKAQTEDELVAAILASTNQLEFVDRRLLIKTIGIEMAERFLPGLPQYVSVNVENLILAMRVAIPDLVKKHLE